MTDKRLRPGEWEDASVRLERERDALRAENEKLHQQRIRLFDERDRLAADGERLKAALAEIADLELEGDASLADAMTIADEALNPPPEPEA